MRVAKGLSESSLKGSFGTAGRLLRQGWWDEEEDAGEVQTRWGVSQHGPESRPELSCA